MIGAGSDVALGKSKLRTLDEGLVGLGATKKKPLHQGGT